jgi:hypothetical protein
VSKDISEPRQNLIIKQTPQELIMLRAELSKPWHADILEKAVKEPTFEAMLGSIAAQLDIALDGYYDPILLMKLLADALANRHLHNDDPHLRAKGLIPVRLEEHENEVHLEFARMAVTNTHGKDKEVAAHNLFMLEHGCQVCHDREECKLANKCLGTEVTKRGADEKVQGN